MINLRRIAKPTSGVHISRVAITCLIPLTLLAVIGWSLTASQGAAVAIPKLQDQCVTLSLQPASRTVNIGDIFTFDVRLEAGTASFDTASLDIHFDPGTLVVVDSAGNPSSSIQQGNLNSTGSTVVASNSVDNTAGTIAYTEALLGHSQTGGTFTVATIRFKAKQATPSTPVTFVNIGNTASPTFTGILFAGSIVAFCAGSPTGATVIVATPTTVTPTPTSTPTPTPTRTPTPSPTRPSVLLPRLYLPVLLKNYSVSPGLILDLLVKRAGQPVANLGVVLYRLSVQVATGTTDLQGKVRFSDLVPGMYTITFDRYSPYYYGSFDLEGLPGQVISKTVPAISLDLRIIEPLPSTPVGPMPVLRWEAYPGAVRYDVYLWARVPPNGPWEIWQYWNTTSTSVQVTRSLEVGRSYAWAVYSYWDDGTMLAASGFGPTHQLNWTGGTPTATPTQAGDTLPDKFLFTIGAQAPVGQFNAPNDVEVGPDGTVYITDADNDRIQSFSATGQFLSQWGSSGSGDGQFNGPSGVAVAPNGMVYVVEAWNNRIQRFSATGQFLGKWGYYGSGEGQFWWPRGVTVASDGTVYVADTGNHRIQRFSATGQFLGKWGSQGNGYTQFESPQGVAIASDGTVYVADTGNNRVLGFTPDGAFVRAVWGGQGSGNGQFNQPRGIAIALDGTVYVIDTNNNRIQHFTAVGAFLEAWGSLGDSDGQFRNPTGISAAPNGTVYIVDWGNQRIQRFSATGQFTGKWGSYGSGDGQFSYPNGAAVAPDGTLYVADTNNHRIQRFSTTGQFLSKWGSYGSGDGQFALPSGVAVAPDSTVYMTDKGNHRIQRFSATGQFLSKWGSQGNGDGQFNEPNGVAVAPDGTVYVTDTANPCIQRFSATGQFLSKWGSSGSGNGQFWWPFGVAIAPDGTVYMADSGNHRIQRFTATGQFLGKWGFYGSSDGQFTYPSGIAAAPDSTVYVVDTYNARIQAFGPAYPTTWRGEYFANRWLAERPVLIRQEAAINFFWHGNPPDPSVPADNFSARWQRYVSFDAGTYRFTVFTDDGVRLWVDDKLLIEAWQDPQVATYSADIPLTQGYHRVRLEYYEASGSAAVQLSWAALP